jgi:hypothetical protein
MKKSIVRLILFSVIPFLVICYSLSIINDSTDDFYKRFTSSQQNSFILGSSRAASMDPEIIDQIISRKFPNAKLYNYAFTWAHSPFGPKYLESIEKKMIPETKDGVFIVTVEPTALMVDKSQPDELKFYVENDKSVAKTSMVSTNPNIEYLIESYDFSITNELNKKIRPPKNAIAEVRILDNGKVDGKIIKQNSPEKQEQINKIKMEEFQVKMNKLKASENRFSYLKKTIEFLQQHGKVILVRMPVNKVPYSIENSAFPDFDEKIFEITAVEKIKYINYNNIPNHYKWTDEVHLSPESMKEFSKVIGNALLNY